MQPSDNTPGCLVTSHINVARCFFQNNKQNWWRIVTFLGTVPSTEHYRPRDWSTSLPVWRPGDCTDHRALYARGLVDQSASLVTWGLHRPPSTICPGTSRPVCQFEDLETAPTNLSTIRSGTSRPAHNLKIRGLYRSPSVICSGTGRLVCSIANKHDMLGDWSISLFNCKRA